MAKIRMGLLQCLKGSYKMEPNILVYWPEGTEYLSDGPFFDEEEG